MKNYDLFQEGETEIVDQTASGIHLSKYQRIKASNHYRKSTGVNKCGNCAEHLKKNMHGKNYHKCKLIGLSDSEATDIQVGAVCDAHRLGVE